MKNAKRIFIVALSMLMSFGSFIFGGCEPDEPIGSPQKVCGIGHEFKFESVSVKVEHDCLKERFIVDLKEIKSGHNHYFDFDLRYKFTSYRDEFEYVDGNGEKIEFGENGSYCFVGNGKFYVSYKNASVDVKEIITRREFTLDAFGGTFINGVSQINEGESEYNSAAADIKMKNEAENERFVLKYEIKNAETAGCLDVIFDYANGWMRNGEEFEYTDELGAAVEFNENGYYGFDTDKTFYISYANASEEIKTAIREEKYHLSVPQITFIGKKGFTKVRA